MKPVIAPLMSEVSFGLCYLVGMVREGVVDTAAVYIKLLAEVLHADA